MDDKRRLIRFVQGVHELRMVQEWTGYKYSLNVDSVKGVSVQMEMPDEEDLRSFLVTFRQFISEKEPGFLNRIYGNCFKRLDPNNQLRERLIKGRQEWQRALKNNGIGPQFNEQSYSPEDVAKLWINGHYFHSDDEKCATLAAMFNSGLGFVKAHFMEFIIEATPVVIHAGNIVEDALKHNRFRF
jgi:hypothetical protein